MHDGVERIVSGRETEDLSNDTADTERTGDVKNSTEHQLTFHGGKGYKVKFLPSVLDTVNRCCFVKRTVNRLKTCDECKERCTESLPEDTNDTYGPHVFGVFKEQNGVCGKAEVKENTVNITVTVTGEEELPYEAETTGKRRSVEEQRQECTGFSGNFVDEPCKTETDKIAYRTCYESYNKCILDSEGEYFVVKEQLLIVGKADKSGHFQHVEVCKTDKQRNENGSNCKCKESYKERTEEYNKVKVLKSFLFGNRANFIFH